MKNNTINRRSALRIGLGGAAGAWAATLGGKAWAAPASSQAGVPKLLIIFLRGGNDGINTVIPDADPDYAWARQSTRIATADSLVLNGFARMHPALRPLKSVWDDGNLALLHRIGHPFLSLSHFTSQQHWETAWPGILPGSPLIEEGYVPRLAQVASGMQGLAFPAASISKALQRAFNTNAPSNVLSHIQRVDDYSLNQSTELRTALGNAFGAAQGGTFASMVAATGSELYNGESLVAAAQGYTTNVPYPQKNVNGQADADFVDEISRQALDSVALLRNTEMAVAGIELGGFDTHSNQGGKDGRQADRLRALAGVMKAVYQDTSDPAAPNLITLVMSEFGRTTIENGSAGTDHGKASVMLAMGRDVQGAVYNCDAGSWRVGNGSGTGAMFNIDGKFLNHKHDFRAVLAEVFSKHFGVSKASTLFSPSEMNSIITLYDTLPESETDEVGFL